MFCQFSGSGRGQRTEQGGTLAQRWATVAWWWPNVATTSFSGWEVPSGGGGGEERAQIYMKVALDLVFSCLLGTLSFEVVRACILDLSLLSGSEAVIVNLSGTALTSQ